LSVSIASVYASSFASAATFFGEPHRILAVRAVIDLDFIVDSGSGEGQLWNGSRTNQARYAPSVPHGIGDVLSTFMRSETTTRTCVPVLVFA
jgi:aminoglycoside N3'-acetyltransferase